MSYEKVIARKRHQAVGKETDHTNHVKKLNNTLRQRISRLVRKSLSFLKCGKSYWGNFVRLQCQISKGLSHYHYYQITTNSFTLE